MSTPVAETPALEPFVVREVRGWLLVLCLILTFLAPLMASYNICFSVIPMLLRKPGPRLTLIAAVYLAIFIPLIGFSIRAGLRLWLVRPGAVVFARRYLWAYLVGNLSYFVA